MARVGKLLVANRGEIACRIFRTCRQLGVATVAVTAPDDREALHARTAGEVRDVPSYLDAAALVAAAAASGADAVHPGYGFLAENAGFAEAVLAAGLTWVGPPPDALRAAGDKLRAKAVAEEAGVPLLRSGTPQEVGFPLLVKAAAGGGGRGMRVVRAPEELDVALEGAAREARSAFGEGETFLERYLERPRHVEVQLLADAHGTVQALGERDCSVQRRHQKVLEESPAPGLPQTLRATLHDAAVAFARAVAYQGAGTAEFLVDGGECFFLELNARIQVEHPVTELVTGLDLVEQQLLVAAGERLAQGRPPVRGHAVEARLYAEHPRDFVPQAGRIERLRLPEGVRVDAGVQEGDDVPSAYDPMIAKLIAHAPTRSDALERLAAALAATEVGGLVTNLPFLRWLVDHPVVRAGQATTAFLAEHPPLSQEAVAANPWRGFWRLNRDPDQAPPQRRAPPQVEDAAGAGGGAAGAGDEVSAPTPGIVVRVLAREGEHVQATQPLVVLESMKMETSLIAPFAATVSTVRVTEGQRVAGGAVLVELEADG